MTNKLACFLLVLLLIAFSSCSNVTVQKTAEEKPVDVVKIGALLPMTGVVAAYGQDAWKGIQLAKEMNQVVLGKKIDVVLVDTKSDKIESATAIRQLIETHKVVAIIGEMLSGNTLAGASIAEKAKIPMVSPTATNPLVTQGKKYIFRACNIDPVQGNVAAIYAFNTLKARSAALIVDKSKDYCVGLAKFFFDKFKEIGGKISAQTFCLTDDKDFSKQISIIISANPDVIYAPNYYSPVALFAKQARELGVLVPIMSGDGARVDQLISIGGKGVEGLLMTEHYHPLAVNTEIGKEFISRFKTKYGVGPNPFNVLSADAYFVLRHALSRAGTTDGESIRVALATITDLDVILGKLSIDQTGNTNRSMVITTVKDGVFVYVTTINPWIYYSFKGGA